ncbi:flagellar hook-associated protein FlgK [Clostridiaceae bacterium UIB06]|uniref:Flagellar hook-associated protein 1 n=1 Tax=Clostridium thailandense TaxID=2794346 RepID=A0A949TN00_9CLOT|nr:flagellar hook-associated protein FlgK [Clostridium thailandense]MBV7272262.1 flagellar hook-associated protein FlgK [Clostridium thailandense]MCH5137808.1 flagellar hook-associated protein FlgK [Clostridiaceae bacterium UIB06]
MAGLFGTFNIATRGLFAQQQAISTTSHNISNANTDGYSRQRVTLQTSRPFPMPDMNNAVGPGQMGTGVDVASVDRIRDSFLDYQVRVENGVNGQFTGRDKFLSEVENVMNEPSDTGMSTLIGKFFDSWNTLATSANQSNSKSMVAQQALALTNDLNHTYTELESIKSNTQTVIKDTVSDINSILAQLSQVNQQIIQVKVAKNNPNDLMDKRDLLLDQLSNKFGINVDKKQFEGYNVTTADEGKYRDVGDDGRPPLAADGTTSLNLVQSQSPDQACSFSYVSTIEPAAGQNAGEAGNYKVTYYKKGDMTNDANKVTITVDIEPTGAPGDSNYVSAADKYNKLNQGRVIWADNSGAAIQVDKSSKTQGVYSGVIPTDGSGAVSFDQLALFQPPTGELKGYSSVQKDIDKYEDQLNKFAKSFAFSVNGIISQSNTAVADTSTNINNFFVNKDSTAVYNGTDTDAIDKAEQGITAANITINQAILDNPMLIKSAAQYDSAGNNLSGESDGTRALAVETLRDKLMQIQNVDSSTDKQKYLKDIFVQDSSIGSSTIYTIKNATGGMTLDSYFKDTIDTLGIQEQEAKRMVSNQATLLAGFKESRDAVSGVSLDEEMANLIQFQHCYQANAKVISTVDELLDVVVNGLKK